MIPPALPPAIGPNPAKAKFFAEAAGAFELMSLFYQLNAEEQTQLREIVVSFAVKVTGREMKTDKGNR